MKRFLFVFLTITILVIPCRMAFALQNSLFNPRFTKGMSGWHGIGQVIYLTPAGVESNVPIKGAIRVLKIPLSPSVPREVYQEFTTNTEPNELHLHIEIAASRDFQRSADPNDYTKSQKPVTTMMTSRFIIPQADFWVRIGPGWVYRTATVSRVWTVIDETFEKVWQTHDRAISFCVPCGQGSVYVRYAEVSGPEAPNSNRSVDGSSTSSAQTVVSADQQ